MLKIVCPKCMGNGYVKVPVDEGRTVEGDCEYCKNQGEVEINEETIGDLVSSSEEHYDGSRK